MNINLRLKKLEEKIAPTYFDSYTVFINGAPYDEHDEGYDEYAQLMNTIEKNQDAFNDIFFEMFIKNQNRTVPVIMLPMEEVKKVVAML